MPSRRDFFCPRSERPFTRFRFDVTRTVPGIACGLALLVAAVWPPARAAGETADGDGVAAVYILYGDRMPPVHLLAGNVFQGADAEQVVDCAGLPGPRTMVALVFGQSNAANTVEEGYVSTAPVYAYHGGVCRKIRDPLPGASDSLGSVWSRLGDKLVATGAYDRVVFADIARGGSSILNWGPRGDLNARLLSSIDELAARGLTPTHVLFHQGEADCAIGLPAAAYRTLLEAVLGQIRARLGGTTPIFISRTTLHQDFGCPDRLDPACYKSCPEIVAVQTALADPALHIFPGPDTDQLVPWSDRRDGYHFSSPAADRFAMAWLPLLGRHDAPSR